MPQLSTRLAICVHEAGHAIVQLAHGSYPWIDAIAIDGLPAGILGLVDTPSIWQPSNLGLAAGRDVHEAWSAGAWRDVVNYLASPIAELRWRRYSRTANWLGAEQAARRCLTETQESFSDFGRVRFRLESAVPSDDHDNFVRAWWEGKKGGGRPGPAGFAYPAVRRVVRPRLEAGAAGARGLKLATAA